MLGDRGDALPVDALGDGAAQRRVGQDRALGAVEGEVIPARGRRSPDGNAFGAPGDRHLVQPGDAGRVDGLVLQRRQSGGVVEHQEGDPVQPRPLAPPSGVAGQHNSLLGPIQRGDDERAGRGARAGKLSGVERLRGRGHVLRQQHGVAGEHAAPFRVGLGEGDDGLAVVDAAGHRLDPFAAVGAGDREVLVGPTGGVDLAGDVLPAERGAVGPGGLRVDGVGDHLRVGPGEFDAAEVVGVDGRGAVRSDHERPRQGRFQHAADVGGVAVDVQGVEVGREFGEREPQVAAVPQGRRVLRVDVAGGADGGGGSGRHVVGARRAAGQQADGERDRQ